VLALSPRSRRHALRLYLDSSALVKLIVPEAETGALRNFVRVWRRQVSSALAAVEVPRAARRHSVEVAVARRLAQVLERVVLIDITPDILIRASDLSPVSLGTLDAIHLASALSLGRDLGGFVTYDEPLAEAAQAAGLQVFAPR
jgi:predicted nucleic acid-binding protein